MFDDICLTAGKCAQFDCNRVTLDFSPEFPTHHMRRALSMSAPVLIMEQRICDDEPHLHTWEGKTNRNSSRVEHLDNSLVSLHPT